MGANGTGRKPPKQRKGATRGRRKAGCAARSEGALWCLTSGGGEVGVTSPGSERGLVCVAWPRDVSFGSTAQGGVAL